MRVLVCGGRNYSNKKRVYDILDNLEDVDLIIEGGARGADRLASEWAADREISSIRYNAEWDKYGKAAGYKRNLKMLNEGKPNLVVAFPGGKGTNNMIHLTIQKGIPLERVDYYET